MILLFWKRRKTPNSGGSEDFWFRPRATRKKKLLKKLKVTPSKALELLKRREQQLAAMLPDFTSASKQRLGAARKRVHAANVVAMALNPETLPFKIDVDELLATQAEDIEALLIFVMAVLEDED